MELLPREQIAFQRMLDTVRSTYESFGFLPVETPRWKDTWLRLDAGYTDTPVLTDTGTDSYSYRYLRLQAFVAF